MKQIPVMIRETPTTTVMSKENTLRVRSIWFFPRNCPHRICDPPSITALIVSLIFSTGIYSPMTAIACGPIRLLAMVPSIMESILPMATIRICTGSRLKNSLDIIFPSALVLIFRYPFVQMSVLRRNCLRAAGPVLRSRGPAGQPSEDSIP